MVRFNLKSKNMFIGQAKNEHGIGVWETNALCQSKVLVSNWKYITSIAEGYPHNELEVHGVVIRGEMLRELSNDLQEHDWIVNCEGLMYMRGRVQTRLGIYNKRLHDFFGWSKYGVQVPEVGTLWNKYELYNNKLVIDAESSKESAMEYKSQVKELEGELRDCKALLQEKEKKLAFYEKELIDELSPCLKLLKEKELEAKILSNQLFAAQKQAEAIEIVAGSLVSFLKDADPNSGRNSATSNSGT